MAGLDGLELTRRLRQLSPNPALKILLTSASVLTFDPAQGRAAGAPAGTGTISQTQSIATGGLLVKSTGDVTLTNPANNAATLAADTAGGNLSYMDADNLAVGGTSIGAPPPAVTGGTTTGLASFGQAVAAATQAATAALDGAAQAAPRRRIVFLDFLGFGSEDSPL